MRANARTSIRKNRDWKTRSKTTARSSAYRQLSRSVVPARANVLPPVRTLNGWGIGFPQKLSVRLKYGTTMYTDMTAGTTWYNVFRGNSIFDPDLTGTGTQPRYHDELQSLYRFYYVTGSRIKVTFNNSSTSNGLLAFVIPDATVSSLAIPTSSKDVIELPGSRYKHLGGEQAGPQPHMITVSRSAKQMQENTREDRVEFGTNPADPWAYVVGVTSYGPQTAGIYVVVEIVYDVIVSELVEPSAS